MSLGFSMDFATSYTQLRDLIKTKIVAAGWTQVGATDIYKSAEADGDGNYAYVEVTDNGSAPVLYASIRLDAAGTGQFQRIGRSAYTTVWNALWHFYIYKKWFYCFKTVGTSGNYALGAGLYRPFPRATMRTHPYFAYGVDTGGQHFWMPGSNHTNKMGRTIFPDGDEYIVGPGMGFCSGNGANTATAPYNETICVGGGLFIHPVLLYSSVTSKGLMGSFYNMIAITGFGWENNNIIPSSSRLAYGGDKVYMVPDQSVMHAGGTGGDGGIAFQIAGSGVTT